MPSEFFIIAVAFLIAFAVFDLIVGVSNDAANFLNSSIGSRVAPRNVILLVASFGIMAGVTFSSGMMEVARKGIFHPQFFTMPDLLAIFLGVMLTDILLLDFFNTFGLPTSTTVSIVFELLGGAVAVSVLKIMDAGGSIGLLGNYINTGTAMVIIFGILLSVLVSFLSGAVVQFFTRLLFSFNYMPRLKLFGGLWGGLVMSSIFYFILIKGAKGASFLSPATITAITSNGWSIIFGTFLITGIFFQLLIFMKVNILKPVILIGTFALAMAFAANDLVNFIGVPLAGLASYKAALASGSPLSVPMTILTKSVPTSTWLLLISGIIMVITLWTSKKARTVSMTEIRLGRQEEGMERFESIALARMIVRMWLGTAEILKPLIPQFIQNGIAKRMNPDSAPPRGHDAPSFDLMRASVNLMVASACISFATSHKLPLSTTYVTFMVSMGTSFADRAWGRDSAVYRITGVLTVIGGWFLTAISAFIICGIIASLIFVTHMVAVPVLLLLILYVVWKNHKIHQERSSASEQEVIFNLKKIKDAPASIATTFDHMSTLIREIRESLNFTLKALFQEDRTELKLQAKKTKKIQEWCNIITANIFKSMRLLQKNNKSVNAQYGQTIRRLQRLSDCHRDIVMRASQHVDNNHKGLIKEQISDLERVAPIILDILKQVETMFGQKKVIDFEGVQEKHIALKALEAELNLKQVNRIVDEASKTRLSILFYAVLGNCATISKQTVRLMEIFQRSFGQNPQIS